MTRFTSYPVIFDARSVDLGGFVEIVRPTAVDRALREQSDVRAFVNHDTSKILGRVRSRTLRLTKESRGLRADIALDERVSYAADLLRVADRGDAPGGSFGFRVIDDLWRLDHGRPVRELLDVELREVSCAVSFPAYGATETAGATSSERGAPHRSLALAARQLRHLLRA